MGTNRLIIIRTDGNSKIATGHLLRCLSIADACHARSMQVVFVVSGKESEALLLSFLSDTPFDARNICRLTHTDAMTPSKEPDELFPLIGRLTRDAGCSLADTVFLLDSYDVTNDYLEKLRSKLKVAYLDDLQLFDYPADLVINYDIIPPNELSAYRAAYRNAGQTLLGGLYTPLRKQFLGRHALLRKEVQNVLVTTGGSDPEHFCLRLAGLLTQSPDLTGSLQFHIVIGRLNTDAAVLLKLASEYSYLKMHENVTDMASLMCSCDLAVSAGGTTLYELCALGIPAISFTMADNQLTNAKAFDSVQAIPYAGDIRFQQDEVLHRVLHFMTDMSQNFAARKNAHEAMSNFVDDRGAARIADALLKL